MGKHRAACRMASTVAVLLLSSCRGPQDLAGVLIGNDARSNRVVSGCSGVPVGTSSIRLVPSTQWTIGVGTSLDYNATNEAGTNIPDCALTWSTSNSRVATIGASGVATGKSIGGPITIQAATIGKPSIKAGVLLSVGAPIATVTITPSSSSLRPGQIIQLSAELRDAKGALLPNRMVIWSSSDPSKAAVSADGKVTGVTSGTAIISATSEGVRGESRVIIGTTMLYSTNPDFGDWYSQSVDVIDGVVVSLAPPAFGFGGMVPGTSNYTLWGSLSPDRKSVITALCWECHSLVRRELGSGIVTTIAAFSGHNDLAPRLSPDGSRIVWAHTETWPPSNSEIWSISSDGAGATRLTADNIMDDNPDIASNNASIVWGRGDADVRRLWLMGGDGSNPRALTTTKAITQADDHPRFSPDGARVAYYSNRSGVWALYVIDVSGTNDREITGSGAVLSQWTNIYGGSDRRAPSWSPDGRLIAFTGVSSAGVFGIYVVKADGATSPVRFTPDGVPAAIRDWR